MQKRLIILILLISYCSFHAFSKHPLGGLNPSSQYKVTVPEQKSIRLIAGAQDLTWDAAVHNETIYTEHIDVISKNISYNTVTFTISHNLLSLLDLPPPVA